MTWALVPAKGFERAKGRLAAGLDPVARSAVARALLARVLTALTSRPLSGILVLTNGEGPAALAREVGAEVLPDAGPLPLAALVDAGLRSLAARGAARALVVMGDLPFLTGSDVDLMIAALDRAEVVVAPDREGRGTNALGLTPPNRVATCFGHPEDSFTRHCRAARAAGATLEVVRSPALAFDLDAPEDLPYLAGTLAG